MASPITDRQSGAVLHPGRYYPGSELGWGGVGGPTPSGESLEGMKKIVFNAGWDYHTMRLPDDVERAVRADQGLLYGGDPDLTRFFQPRRQAAHVPRVGGSAGHAGRQPDHVQADQRGDGACGDELPRAVHGAGMGHCQGGPGTDVFDKIAALDQWVESGTRPQSIPASHMTGTVTDRTRPLCAYPAIAHYIGSGSTMTPGISAVRRHSQSRKALRLTQRRITYVDASAFRD